MIRAARLATMVWYPPSWTDAAAPRRCACPARGFGQYSEFLGWSACCSVPPRPLPRGSAPVRGLLVIENFSGAGGARLDPVARRKPTSGSPATAHAWLGRFATVPERPLFPRTRASSPTPTFAAETCSSDECRVARCEPCCAVRVGLDASPTTFAWSPDSRFLAVAAGGLGTPSVLRIVDLSGRIVKSFSEPRVDPNSGEPVATEVISWSPDGSRLLLEQTTSFGAGPPSSARSAEASRADSPSLSAAMAAAHVVTKRSLHRTREQGHAGLPRLLRSHRRCPSEDARQRAMGQGKGRGRNRLGV